MPPEQTEAAAIELVLSFFDAWNRMAFEDILDHLSNDVLYHNIPLDPLQGADKVRRYLESAWRFEAVNWEVHHIAATGNTVLTERTDHFVINGSRVSLPLMGTFCVKDNKIAIWRDYFDLNSYREQLSRCHGQTGTREQAELPGKRTD